MTAHELFNFCNYNLYAIKILMRFLCAFIMAAVKIRFMFVFELSRCGSHHLDLMGKNHKVIGLFIKGFIRILLA